MQTYVEKIVGHNGAICDATREVLDVVSILTDTPSVSLDLRLRLLAATTKITNNSSDMASAALDAERRVLDAKYATTG